MPRRKFPNTLRRVSMDAVNARKEYRDRFDRSIGSGSRLGKVSLESYPTFYDASADEVVEASREHYHAHEAEYYDLALIDAHLEGVVINTPSPLTIGMRPEEALAEPPSNSARASLVGLAEHSIAAPEESRAGSFAYATL